MLCATYAACAGALNRLAQRRVVAQGTQKKEVPVAVADIERGQRRVAFERVGEHRDAVHPLAKARRAAERSRARRSSASSTGLPIDARADAALPPIAWMSSCEAETMSFRSSTWLYQVITPPTATTSSTNNVTMWMCSGQALPLRARDGRAATPRGTVSELDAMATPSPANAKRRCLSATLTGSRRRYSDTHREKLDTASTRVGNSVPAIGHIAPDTAQLAVAWSHPGGCP